MSEDRDIVWERQPGRRWLVTIWQPGEREREASWARQLANYQSHLNRATPSFGFGACPCCGQSPAAYQVAPGLFGIYGL